MKRTLLFSLVLIALLSTAALATMPIRIWFSDNFDSYSESFDSYLDGSPLSTCAPNWTGTGDENKVYSGEVRMRGYSDTGGNSTATSLPDVTPQSTGISPQIMHIRVRGNDWGSDDPDPNPPVSNHAYIYMETWGGTEIGRWYGWTTQLTPRIGGSVGPQVSLADGLYHDLDIVYDPVSGLRTFYKDGELWWAPNNIVNTGLAVGNIRIYDLARAASTVYCDNVWVDECGLGTVPEPSSLLALSVFGALGLIRRRK